MYIDIARFRTELVTTMSWASEKHIVSDNIIVDDFILLCFMVGNDFLPHVPSIEIIEDGISLIIGFYRSVASEFGHFVEWKSRETGSLTPSLNLRALEAFFKAVSSQEQVLLEKKLSKKESYFPDQLLEHCSSQCSQGKWNVDIEKYRKEYLKEHFAGYRVSSVCHEYIDGMHWVLEYYFNGVPDWSWVYPLHYGPSAFDLASHIGSYKFSGWSRSRPSLPMLQLLSVLPPKSAQLLPPALGDLLCTSDSPLKSFCPDSFDIDLSGKRREWEGIALLPFLDYRLVSQVYRQHILKVDNKDRRRDISGKSFLYQFDPSFQKTFHSYYGDIINSHVTTSVVDL